MRSERQRQHSMLCAHQNIQGARYIVSVQKLVYAVCPFVLLVFYWLITEVNDTLALSYMDNGLDYLQHPPQSPYLV